MHAAQGDAMEMRAATQRYTGPSAGRIASLIPREVSFERGWFRTSDAVCHGGDEPDGLAFRQRPDGNGIDVRCHSGGCTRGHIVTAIEGLIGLPIWTAYEPIPEGDDRAASDRLTWPHRGLRGVRRFRRLALATGGAALLGLPLLLGGGAEAAVTNVAAFGVAVALLAGLPGRTRRAFRS